MLGIPGVERLALVPPATIAPARRHGFEKRIAAVYDDGVVGSALVRKHNIAFFAINGTFAPRARRVIEKLAESAFGVDKGSARVSVESAALSLAFDPQRVAFGAMQSILDRKLTATRLSLLPMRIMGGAVATGT